MLTCLFLYAVYFSMSDAVLDFVLHSRATALPLYHFGNESQYFFLIFFISDKSWFLSSTIGFLRLLFKKIRKFNKKFLIYFFTFKNFDILLYIKNTINTLHTPLKNVKGTLNIRRDFGIESTDGKTAWYIPNITSLDIPIL